MLELFQYHRLTIYLTILIGSFLKLCTAYPQTEPAWALFAFVLLGYLDWHYIGRTATDVVD